MEEEQLLTTREAAKIVGIAWQTVLRWFHEGRYPGYKLGHQLRFKASEIRNYVNSMKQDHSSSKDRSNEAVNCD